MMRYTLTRYNRFEIKMPQTCKICAYPDQAAVRAAFATGHSDRDLAKQFGVSPMAIGRHRRMHLVAPMAAAAAALDKGRAVREQREQQLTAVAAGDPLAFIGLTSIVSDLRQVHARLERQADGAEADGQRTALAQLSGQQLRTSEVRAKLGAVGGYAPPKTLDQAALGAQFNVQIVFSGGQVERINTLPPVITAEPVQVFDADDATPADDEGRSTPAPSDTSRIARAFGAGSR
jgi:hypothetical protein